MKGYGETTERVRQATVLVLSPQRGGSGSGVLLPNNRIVTNAHVAVQHAPTIELWSGERIPATVERRDRRRDLALLCAPVPAGAAVLPLRDSATVKPGEIAIAVGNPMGFLGAVSTGTVYAVGPLRGLGGEAWVQANVRLAPGNSGGPLTDVSGYLIGINTMVVSGGLALAIPSAAVQRFLSARAPFQLGVTVRAVGGDKVPHGLLILEVHPNSAAERAAMLPGDIITGVDGGSVQTPDSLADALDAAHTTVRIRFLRGSYDRVRESVARAPNREAEAA
jgi:serine protease Do